MFGVWTPIVALGVIFLPLLWISRWTSHRLQELSIRLTGDSVVALYIYFAVLAPGVVLHELSHYIAALVLGVPVRGFSLGPVRPKGRGKKQVSLGSIRVGKVGPLRAGLIGIAPLFGGVVAVLLIGYLVLGAGDLGGLIARRGTWAGAGAWLATLPEVRDLWLWVYLVFAVSNAMLPSESDMATVRPVLIVTGLVLVVLVVIVGLPNIPEGVIGAVNSLAGYLASAFGLTLAADAVFALLLLPMTWITRYLQDQARA